MPLTEQSVPGQAPQTDEEGAGGQQPESECHWLLLPDREGADRVQIFFRSL